MNQVKIIDFGCAVYEQHEDPPTYYTMFTGTRTYAPPGTLLVFWPVYCTC
jgi:serine/threonine protein kinase